MVKKWLLVIFCAVVIHTCLSTLPKKITLGGFFDNDDPSREVFAPYAQVVNQMRHNEVYQSKVFFDTVPISITNDLFEISQTACALLEDGVAAIFGPSKKKAAELVQNMCDGLGMPNIVWREHIDTIRQSINLYPHYEELALLFDGLVSAYNWKGFTILYDNSDSLILLSGLLQKYNSSGPTVTVRHLGNGPSYRNAMIQIRKTIETNIIIACSSTILEEVLKQSLQSGILSEKHQVIVTSLDLQAVDLEPYKYSGVNLTGIRLVDVNSEYAQEIFKTHLEGLGGVNELSEIRVAQALTYDALQLFSRSLNEASYAGYSYVMTLSCNSSAVWDFGISLSNYLRTAEMKGLTGLVKMHTNGFRSDFKVDIVRLNETGLLTAGTYNTTTGFDWRFNEAQETMKNLTFKVLITLIEPYNMLTNSSIKQTGNDRYEGYAIDIIKLLAERLHFNYTFIVHTGGYGTKGKDGKWNGLLGDIVSGNGDLAITDLTITAERQSAVDFTTPFMSLGIAILYKKPTGAMPSLFSFLAPFSNEVYYYLVAAYISTSLCLWAVGRMCPAEWNCPYPCIEEPEELENQFTLKNALWFTLGSIMQQGSEIVPTGLSTRMLAAAWWFFCMIMVASYTANIAALLVVETVVKPFTNAEQLADLNFQIKYGAKRDGATVNFFNTSDVASHRKMFQNMMLHDKEVMTDSNDEGRDKVVKEDGKYAFLMESTSIAYITQRYCGLAQAGEQLDSKGYGIAMRKGFPYRRKLNNIILALKEDGTLKALEEKWWNDLYNDAKCSKAAPTVTTSSEMTLDHVGGVFLVLGIGVVFAAIFTIWEYIWDICWTAHTEPLSFRDEFIRQTRFVLKCKGHVRPARGRSASSDDFETDTRDQTTPPFGSIPTVMTTSLEN